MDREKFEAFLKKVDEMKKSGGVDITAAEDLSIAVMNLVSLEEHFYFTAEKTGKPEYFDTAVQVREIRKDMLKKLMPDHEGETWCASKHLLAATMRLIEVGTRYQADGQKEEAKAYYDRAYAVYSIFWALKMRLATVKEVADVAKKENVTLEDIVTKLADCCNE